MWSSHAENLLPKPNSLIDVNSALFLTPFTCPLLHLSPYPLLKRGIILCLLKLAINISCSILCCLFLTSDVESHPLWGTTKPQRHSRVSLAWEWFPVLLCSCFLITSPNSTLTSRFQTILLSQLWSSCWVAKNVLSGGYIYYQLMEVWSTRKVKPWFS